MQEQDPRGIGGITDSLKRKKKRKKEKKTNAQVGK
jgi:hypothetical protein